MLHPYRRDDLIPAVTALAHAFLLPCGYAPTDVRVSAEQHPEKAPVGRIQLTVHGFDHRPEAPAWEFRAQAEGPDAGTALVALRGAIRAELLKAHETLSQRIRVLTKSREAVTSVLLNPALTTPPDGIHSVHEGPPADVPLVPGAHDAPRG